MIKEIYLVRETGRETYTGFRDRILQAARKVDQMFKPIALSVTLTEEKPPLLSVIPFRRGKIAAFSLKREEGQPLPMLLELEGFDSVNRVEEALPVACKKTWPDGERTPGICLLTLFRQRKNIDYQTFLDRWHNSHTPLSLRIHPLWHYSRNVVREIPHAISLRWDGIVEEHVRTRPDLLNPFRFFGKPHVVLARMLHVLTDTRSFIDYSSMETWLVQEYIFRNGKTE